MSAPALPPEIFDVQTNVPLLHQVVTAQLAAARQGTHATKTRGEVRGGGRKPYRQKGTGRARQGSVRAPQFAGGATVHGPQPRNYSQRTPKKMKAAALRGALSDRARHGRVHVIDAVVTGTSPSTAQAAATLGKLTDRRKFLVVLEREDVLGYKSVRNLQEAHVLVVDQLNTYDVLCADDVVFTRGALDALTARAGKPRGEAAAPAPVDAPAADAPVPVDAPAAGAPADAVAEEHVLAPGPDEQQPPVRPVADDEEDRP